MLIRTLESDTVIITPHFMDEKIEAQKDEETCLTSHGNYRQSWDTSWLKSDNDDNANTFLVLTVR